MTYSVSIHMKQGDDLAWQIGKTKSLPEALRAWAKHLKKGAEAIDRLADVCAQAKIEVFADTNCISLAPQTKEAERLLEAFISGPGQGWLKREAEEEEAVNAE